MCGKYCWFYACHIGRVCVKEGVYSRVWSDVAVGGGLLCKIWFPYLRVCRIGAAKSERYMKLYGWAGWLMWRCVRVYAPNEFHLQMH
jgi:hypothetical protein